MKCFLELKCVTIKSRVNEEKCQAREAWLHQAEKTQVAHKASALLCLQPFGSHFDPMTTTL